MPVVAAPSVSAPVGVLASGRRPRSRTVNSGCLKHLQNRVGVVLPAGRLRKPRPILQVQSNRFVDNLAQFGEYGSFVITMTPTEKQSRTASDKTLVFVGPLDNLHVPSTCLHRWASLMADLTAFS